MRVIAAAALFSLAAAGAARADQIWLTMDQVRPYILEKPAGEIVVGNPAIADVTVQDKRRLLLFGKAPGQTNLYIFDDNGETIDNLIVRVESNSANMLIMHKGASRTTFSCASQCEPTITVGDGGAAFDSVSQQVQQKLSQAREAAAQE